jgi:outer membrane protein assembly factor BamD
MLSWVRGMLARYELYVARYYLNRDNFDAAVARAQYALTTYEDTGLEPEALVLLGETYMKQGEKEKARGTFESLLQRYPSSAFTVPAKRFLAQLDEPVKTQKIGATAASPN